MPHPDTETAVALDAMDKHELLRGLMRGDRESMKLGYSVPAAMATLDTIHPRTWARWRPSSYAPTLRASTPGCARARPATPTPPDDCCRLGDMVPCEHTGLAIPECSCRACLLLLMRKHGSTQLTRILTGGTDGYPDHRARQPDRDDGGSRH
jgi:hypothetical protein